MHGSDIRLHDDSSDDLLALQLPLMSIHDALRKRKKAMRESMGQFQTVSKTQTAETRATVCTKFESVLGVTPDAKAIAKELEGVLFGEAEQVSGEYRTSFRRIFLALKPENSPLKKKLLSKEISPQALAELSADELKSADLKVLETAIRSKNLAATISHQTLPENITKIKDGRDREKWGVGRSAAAIDDDD